MIVTKDMLDNLCSHWAIESIPKKELERAKRLIAERIASQAVGTQIHFDFAAKIPTQKDEALLEKVSLAYEMAAVENLVALGDMRQHNEESAKICAAAAFELFDFVRLEAVPEETEARIYFVLKLFAIAYCGDRGSDLRRKLGEKPEMCMCPSVADVPWDKRILYRLFDCWVKLIRKKGWNDLHATHEIIAGLREDQKKYEKKALDAASNIEGKFAALRLVALYHWAKATELLASYLSDGQNADILVDLEKHFEAAIDAADASSDTRYEVLLRWLQTAALLMVRNSLWFGTRTVNSRVSRFVKELTQRSSQPMFELLPPQRAALLEKGLLDQAKTAVVIDMPTSGGKTLLAQFRILQALNQFDQDHGWVAYVAPTRALVAQITRRLRRDFEPIGIHVQQLTGAIDIDAFESDLLSGNEKVFNVLVATPEKLSLVIRNKKVQRPLALLVLDEAHNMETESRGLRIELLLATVKHDSPTTNYLLLMPYVEHPETISKWLADDSAAGNSISFSTTAWKPNERIIGLYRAVEDEAERAGWHLEYETLSVSLNAMKLRGIHQVGGCKPLNVPKSRVIKGTGEQSGLGLQTAAMASVLSQRNGISIAVANSIPTVWSMARTLADQLPVLAPLHDDIRLVQNFLKDEIDESFELVSLLERGIGVHHAGLSDETRALMEWLAENGRLKILCATTTIAQGINFPVSSIFLASHKVPIVKGKQAFLEPMSPREFWNLVGRAGRIDHDSVGVIGLAEGTDKSQKLQFIRKNTGALVSRLVSLLEELEKQGELNNLEKVLWKDQWTDFRCYISHLLAEKQNLEEALADSEQLLRHTYGYAMMSDTPSDNDKAKVLLDTTKKYLCNLAGKDSRHTQFADATGFSPEGVGTALKGLDKLERKLKPDDWTPESLFGTASRMSDLFGIMLKIPQVKEPLEEITGKGTDEKKLANITLDWVNGVNLRTIAARYFSGDNSTTALSDACRAIYRSIVNNGTWGVSALSHVSGLDFEKMSDEAKRRINILPAMVYHGVRSEEAVLMRMNNVPRSIAESLGKQFGSAGKKSSERYTVAAAHTYLSDLSDSQWDSAAPRKSALRGEGYRKIWDILSGEAK